MKIKMSANKKNKPLAKWIISLLLIIGLFPFTVFSQVLPDLTIIQTLDDVRPLDKITVKCIGSGTISVKDASGREYVNMPATPLAEFYAGGTAGKHIITLTNKKGKILASTGFNLGPVTNIDDNGKSKELFEILKKGLYDENGKVTWNGKTYNFYVPWVLDNNNVMSGIQYFLPWGNEFTDLMRNAQREDGMIWSFVRAGNEAPDYYQTAYSPINFFRVINDAWFVRQPPENHPEYNYVNMFYKHWKASGDSEWMKATLESAARALDYCVTDSIRWSKRFQLLKRPYCIDSWDFQVDDEYTPYAPISPTMVVVPGKTKYGIFFGDNTGYYEACLQLAEMYEYAGNHEKASKYRIRAEEILKRLIDLSWNGKYFTHFIDEDPTVKRNLGVDEKSQIAQANAYSTNRRLPNEINVAIIKTYLELKNNLPSGSPGEWYSIYPPFEKGFGQHDAKWQYMNGGVAGHAMGELARGAYENGYENYASEIIDRMLALSVKYGDKLYFSYTGSIPPPPAAPLYKPIDISAYANMDLFDKGGKNSFTWMNDNRPGNDMRGLPVGDQVYAGIRFKVIDPEQNQRKSVIALSTKPGFPRSVEVPVNDMAGAICLLHSSSDNIPSNVAGAITFIYTDGTEASRYLMKHKEVTNWWFSELKTERSGIAWSGPNLCSTKVGVCWAVIDNPQPDKKIEKLQFHAPLEGGIYAVIGITVADKPLYIEPKAVSFGGPDNWAAALGMAALVEGLAGVKNDGLAFDKVTIAPRWTSASVDSVNVTIHFPASDGYVAYQYFHNKARNEIDILLTGSGDELKGHILLPANISTIKSLQVGDNPVQYKISNIEKSYYADFTLSLPSVQKVVIRY
jgi:hypothetical protein